MTTQHNPSCGLDCVSAGAVRKDQPFDPDKTEQYGEGYITALIKIALSSDASADDLRNIAMRALKWSEVQP